MNVLNLLDLLNLLTPKLWLLALVFGFLLDLLLGDPHWAPHPVKAMGHLISMLEKALRRLYPKTEGGELVAGAFLVLLVAGISVGTTVLALWLCALMATELVFAFQILLSYQLLATKSLAVESKKVYTALEKNDVEQARFDLSMIVGRDTKTLEETGITKAAVETVAENLSDGVIAPLLFLALGGVPLGVAYKAVNTMDSMVGYQNEKYLFFGRCAAKLDDVLNFLPARLAGVLLCLVARPMGERGGNAWKIFLRDRKNHKSPNSAHTEAACAGALGIQLGGGSFYLGKWVEKPTMGDPLRDITPEDILKAHKLLYGSAILALLLCCGVPLLLLG